MPRERSASAEGLTLGRPTVVLVFGTGLATFVAPLTAAVLGAEDEDRVGVALAVNNAVARLAGLLATVLLPLAAGLAGSATLRASAVAAGFERGMWISAGLCAAGAAVAWLTVRGGALVAVTVHPSPQHDCAPAALGKRTLAGRARGAVAPE